MKNKQKIGILVEMLVMFATLSSVAGTMNSSNNFERGTSNFVDVEIKKNVDSYNEDELVSAERAPFSVTVTDLGAGFISQVLNDLGQVLGEFNGEAVIWSEGSIEVIETPGDNPTEAYDINNLGEVVGYYIDGYLYTAFFWDGTSHDVKKPYSEYEIDSKAFAINDVGKIVGCVLFDFFPYKWYAASWDDYLTVPQGPTLPYPWPSAEPDLYAIDVNELEDVVGYYWNYIDGYVPWYWQDESLQAQYLETGDLTDVRPTGINDNGQIIGYGTLSGYYRSCLWENYLADPEILRDFQMSDHLLNDFR